MSGRSSQITLEQALERARAFVERRRIEGPDELRRYLDAVENLDDETMYVADGGYGEERAKL